MERHTGMSSGTDLKDYCIVGAGVGGLTLAYLLREAGHSVTVIEATDTPGGAIQTISSDGFLLELGPNSSLAKPEFLQLCSALGLNEELSYPTSSLSKYLVNFGSGNRRSMALVKAPTTPWEAVRSPILSARSKLRAALEPLCPHRSSEDESVEQLISRRFGKGVAHEIVSAVLGGIWAADISRLSSRSALPSIWQQEQHGTSTIFGTLRQAKLNRSTAATPHDKGRGKVVSFKQGMATLPRCLAAVVDGERDNGHRQPVVRYNTQLTSFELDRNGVVVTVKQSPAGTISSERFSKLILTCAAPATCNLLAGTAGGLVERISRIPYAPLGVAHVAYKKSSVGHSLDGFGFLVPPSQHTVLLGAIFSSSVFPGRAPEGYHLLTCFTGGAKHPAAADVTKSAIYERMLYELRNLIGAEEPPLVLSQRHYPRAIPNYPVGHHRIQRELREYEQSYPQVRILANWDHGLGVPDRVEAAYRLAEQLSREQTGKQNWDGLVVNA